MQVCQHCKGPLPEKARADAVYCSTSCKLKAQRQRKKDAVATPSITAQAEPPRSPVVSPPADAESKPEPIPAPAAVPVLSLQPEVAIPKPPTIIAPPPDVANSEASSVPVEPPQTLPLRMATPAEPIGDSTLEGRLIPQSVSGSKAPHIEAPPCTQPANTSSAAITAQRPTQSAQAPFVKETPAQTPPGPKHESLGRELGTSLFAIFELFADYKRQTENEAAQRRAKETPEERQKREALDEKARRRMKKFDRFF